MCALSSRRVQDQAGSPDDLSRLRASRSVAWISGLKIDSPNEQLRGLTRGARLARAAKAKKQRQIGYLHTLGLASHGTFPWPAIVTLWRIAPRAFDADNLAGAFKHVRDGVAGAFCLPDDDKHGLTFAYRQARGKAREYAIAIEVQRAPGE